MSRVLRGVLPLSLVVLEFCWLYPWVLLFTGVFYGALPVPLLPPPAAFVLLALAFLAVRRALAQPWSLRTARAVVVAAGLTTGLAAVKTTYYASVPAYDLRWIPVLLRAAHDALPAVAPPVMGALLATLLWWRGLALGEREFTHHEIDRAFRRGVGWTILFIIIFVIYGDTRGFALTQSAPAYLLAFFSVGLLMLAVTRLLAIWQETQADEGQALAANRHWLLLLVGVVGLILSGAAFISGALNIQFRPTVLQWLRPLGPLVEVLFLALFAVALVIAKAIVFVLSRLPFRPVHLEPGATLDQPLSTLMRDLPPRVVSGARWGVVALVIALLIVLIAITVVRARRRARRRDEDERESVWDAQSLLSGMGRAWRSLWSRWTAPRPAAETPEVSSIRAIYRELLHIGSALGAPRHPAETPFEYRPRLRDRLPANAAEIAALTEAYVRVRYTPNVPGPGDVEEARAALERVRASGADPR